VREIESLDTQGHVPNFETFASKIPIFGNPSNKSPTHEKTLNREITNHETSKIPKLLSGKMKAETYPDVSDIFLARTEELLNSSRSKSGKKRRHTTIEEPKFNLTAASSSEVCSTLVDLSSKRQSPHLPLKRSDSPTTTTFEHFHSTNFEHFHGPRSFILNEVDAGIGSR
jgi:hypothetical protein